MLDRRMRVVFTEIHAIGAIRQLDHRTADEAKGRLPNRTGCDAQARLDREIQPVAADGAGHAAVASGSGPKVKSHLAVGSRSNLRTSVEAIGAGREPYPALDGEID